jgi:hypothetical protein
MWTCRSPIDLVRRGADQPCGFDRAGFDPDLGVAVSIETTEILSLSSVPVTRTRMSFFAVIDSR